MTEPFDVLSWREEMHTNDWVCFFQEARECFTDQVSVDWGTTAWKATKDQLMTWASKSGNSINNQGRLKDGITYGVVFSKCREKNHRESSTLKNTIWFEDNCNENSLQQ